MWALLALPVVRKIGGAILIVAALGAIAYAVYHAGKHAGEASEAGREAETNKMQFDRIDASLKTTLATNATHEQQLVDLVKSFAASITAARSTQQQAQVASKNDLSTVMALPDATVKGDLEKKLGGPLESTETLRHADAVVTDYPHKLEELAGAREEIAADEATIDATRQQLDTVKLDRVATLTAYNSLVPLYAQAYGAAVQGHRKWWCLWVCSRKKTFGLPEPASLTLAPVVQPH